MRSPTSRGTKITSLKIYGSVTRWRWTNEGGSRELEYQEFCVKKTAMTRKDGWSSVTDLVSALA